MHDYRRNRVEGATYFFTLALADRHSDLLVTEVDALRASVSCARALNPFSINAWVVLPEHQHAAWTLPDGDADLPQDGPSSSAVSQQELRKVRAALPQGLPKESVAFGSGDFGNTRPAIRRILQDMSIMSISTRSSMDLSAKLAIGRFHLFGAPLPVVLLDRLGE